MRAGAPRNFRNAARKAVPSAKRNGPRVAAAPAAAVVALPDGVREGAMTVVRCQRCSCAALVAVVWLGSEYGLHAAPQINQQTYASPQEAVSALIAASRSHNLTALRAVFGQDGERLLSSGDPYADEAQQRRFVSAYDEKHALVQRNPDRVELDVGSDDWPFPIPIIESGGRWRFDTQARAQEIIDRRIGRNELGAIRVSLTYVEAQREYFTRKKQETGTGFYAEHLVSTAGRQDGLYWPAPPGGPESPLGPLVAEAEEGYPGERVNGKPIPYQGYYFRILKVQGPNAQGGAKDYVQSGRMTGGFALIAWPAGYASSGIMSFEVNQDGAVFQKDLGHDTGQAAATITRFDPDLTWARIEVTDR